MNFPNKKMSEELLISIELNLVCIEDLNNTMAQAQNDEFAQLVDFN